MIVHLANWSRPDLHGPGRKLCAMALPRSWEHGDGRVPAAAPDATMLRLVKQGRISVRDYLLAFKDAVEDRRMSGRLDPGLLQVIGHEDAVVRSGDTLLCACSARRWPAAAELFASVDTSRMPCHLEVLASSLAYAGWQVVLYGRTLRVEDYCVVHDDGSMYWWDPADLHRTRWRG